MKNIISIVAVIMMALIINQNASAQRSYVTGYFALDLDGATGVIAPIDNKGNATIDNVSPGTHTLAMLLPAVQKVREAAARGATIDIESFSWGVSNTSVVVAGSHSLSGGKKEQSGSSGGVWKTMPPKSAPLSKTIKYKGEEYYKIELENILVSSYQTGGTDNSRPQESLSLNFTKIVYKYDLKENKK